MRNGRLTGPPLFRLLQDVFNEGSTSQTEGFALQVQELYTTAINADAEQRDPAAASPGSAMEALAQRAEALRSRCAAD